MNPIIVIPARMASTRLPGKPLALIGGRPMILHVLDRALEAAVGPVLVACSEPEVAEAVRREGGQAVLTDPDLPSGSDRVLAALAQVDPEGAHGLVINLQGDLPTIPPAQIVAVRDALSGSDAELATLVAPITSAAEAAAPSVVKAACGFAPGAQFAPALYFSRAAIPWGDGPLWHHIGIYGWRRAALARFVTLPPSPLELREKLEQLRALEAGMRIVCARVDAAPHGVDTEEDLARARRAMQAG